MQDTQQDFSRQLDFLDPQRAREANVDIVGVGGIGSYTALALAKMGIGKLTLWDDDKVEPHNIPSQLYPSDYEGARKVEAVRDMIYTCTNDIPVVEIRGRFSKASKPHGEILIAAVDTMKARKMIYHSQAVTPTRPVAPVLLIDGRLSGQYLRVYSIYTSEFNKEYKKTLYSDKDTPPVSCTAMAICYMGFIIGGLIASQARRYLMGEDVPFQIVADLNSYTFLVS